MESYVFGYPMVIMDVTRDVITAAPHPTKMARRRPINQFAKMPRYVSPEFKNVVRISLNSLWTTAWLDLDREPIVLSVPDTHDRYYVFSMMNMWTDVFGSVGKRTTGTGTGAFLDRRAEMARRRSHRREASLSVADTLRLDSWANAG